MSRPQHFGCFSNIWQACRCQRATKEPNNTITQDHSELIHLRGDGKRPCGESPDSCSQPVEHLYCQNLEVLSYNRFPSGCGRSVLSPSTKSDNSSTNRYYYSSDTSSRTDSHTKPDPLFLCNKPIGEDLTEEQSAKNGDQSSSLASRTQFLHHKGSPFLTLPIPRIMEPGEQSQGESKGVVKSHADETQGSAEKIPGMEAMVPTKITSQQLLKEQKNLKANEKKIAAQVDKLKKTRGSISDYTPEKKREKAIKDMGKTAEQVAVLEIERDATQMKITRLQEVMSERGSLFSVVRRNTAQSTQIGTANVVIT